MSEPLFTVFAAYYASDGFDWQQQGDELNRVDVFADPFRVISHAESNNELLFNTELYSACHYEKPSSQFHQWTAADGEAFGLSFASQEEADAFAAVIEGAIAELNQPSGYVPPSTAAAGKRAIYDNEPVYDDDIPPAEPPAEMPSDSMQSMLEVPPPKQFQLTRSAIPASDPSWRRVETMLRLTYPSRLRPNLQMTSLTELASSADCAQFEQMYSGFRVTDVWLNVENDAVVGQTAKDGFASLGTEQLSFGIPLGNYLLDHDEICGEGRQIVLCKAVLGRSLPMTESTLNALQEAPLPVGYHSFSITPGDDGTRSTSTFGNIPLGVFEHSFLVPNTSFVVMTHLVNFNVKDQAATPLREEGAMSLLQSHPEALSGKYRDEILAACDSQFLSRPEFLSQGDTQWAVDRSYEKVIHELSVLADRQAELQDNLEAFQDSVDYYKVGALDCSQQFKRDMVSYLSHTMEVGQSTKDSPQFEVKRLLSDINRMQELFMYIKDTTTTTQLIGMWKQLHQLSGAMKREANAMMRATPYNPTSMPPHMMGLTRKNKRIVGLRRAAALKDGLISRLATLLQEKGALTSEDKELIALI